MTDQASTGIDAVIAKEITYADELLEKADAQGLRNLLAVSHKREKETVSAMVTLCGLYSDKAVSRHSVSDDPNSIAAIRDIALAAINLAMTTLSRTEKP